MATAVPPGNIVDSLSGVRVVVLGDIMLDRFIYGDVNRISPESPVPVLAVTRESRMLGGAGNVIANLCSLGTTASMIGLTGSDAGGQELRVLLDQSGCSSSGLVSAADRPTTVKTRYLGNSQHMLRVDDERVMPLSEEMEDALLANLRVQLAGAQVLVLSDYGKGVLSDRVAREAIKAAHAQGIPVLVDPKGKDYSKYAGATVITPNRKELSEATLGMPCQTDHQVVEAAQMVLASTGAEAVVATRSEQGISIVAKNAAPVHLPTEALEVFDVSGAGDTVMATLAAALGAGADLVAAARLANIAAGVVVAKVGTAAVTPAELRARIDPSALASAGALSWDQACSQVKRWQDQGLKVGFTNGCFDILHAGHVNYLNETRRYCDRLVLGLNCDQSVRLLKGPERPVNTEQDRATVMAGLSAVAAVVLFGATAAGEDNTPCALIERLQPDIFFKGGDYAVDSLPEARIVAAYGGEVRIMGLTEGRSTTGTIAKIEKASKGRAA